MASEGRNYLAQMKRTSKKSEDLGSDAVMPPVAGQKYSVALTIASPRYFFNYKYLD